MDPRAGFKRKMALMAKVQDESGHCLSFTNAAETLKQDPRKI